MNRKHFVGRYQECARLERCLVQEQAQLIIVYGRRRVGKTFLIHQFFEGRFDFKLTGFYDQPRDLQLRNFSSELNRQSGTDYPVPEDWIKAFELLRAYLESFPSGSGRVVFFDEMPWLDTHRSGFLPAFEWFWNSWGSMQNNLIFIVCGSATSWMKENIDENKGGLFSRQTCRLYLEPFRLYEIEEYLRLRGFEWSRYDVAECSMILGGIPYYLSLLDPEMSFADNIDNLFFRKRAELWDEFDHLYRVLFSGSEKYIRVVETLSGKRSGMTRKEIASGAKLPENGDLSKILNDLVYSGFIRIEKQFGRRKKEVYYQLADYYTLFYYRFIKEYYGRDEHFWRNMVDNPSRRAWAGLTFELLCKDHIPQIKQKLGIAGVLSEESAWRYIKKKGSSVDVPAEGAQIDLLIDRRDRVINICEIKFSMNEFEMDGEYEKKLRDKIQVFQQATECKKTIQLTMITTFGVKKGKYSGRVGSQVTLDDLFRDA